jgi:FixJ family two-component response regulator
MEQTVYIIDDDPAIAEVISKLLNSVTIKNKSYSSAENFLAEYQPEMAACLILDIRMHGISGLQLQKIFNKNKDPTPIIFITGHGDIQMTRQAMKAGAVDFLTKPFSNQELLDNVQQVLRNNIRRQKEQEQQQKIMVRFATLTKREKQIMHAIVNGKSNKEIAQELQLSISTVETHRAKVMTKMKVASFAELVRIASLHDLTW